MASASTPSPSSAAPRKPAATTRKPATTRSTPASSRSTRSTAQRSSTQAKRNATVAGNARTRAVRATATEAKSSAKMVGAYAERAVHVPVGAALTARDKVVELVSDMLDTYSTRKKTEAQLKRFERRGEKATKVVTARVDDVSTQIQSAASRVKSIV
ncbi:MAG TPA: hypothetical protein VFR49_13495 [Solirubrobacteraceae bacterium]|nr:hypothetical protein [Solirubrobacteraceae bacterium]